MIKKFELYIKDIVRGKRRGVFPFLIKTVLLPFSWLYGFGVHFRNQVYEKGWMRRYVPPVSLVVSVGNIVAGGTGKTPVTLLLAGAFYERFTVAILSRGYRSKAEKQDMPILLCEGNGPVFPSSYCGDEPYVYAKRLPKSIIIVGGNRRKASFLAARAGAQAIFLDDGMQHRRVARDFDVVVVDIGDPFGHGYFLPRGFLRDTLKSFARANLIILNHTQGDEQFAKVKAQLKPYSSAPVVGANGSVADIKNLQGHHVVLQKKEKAGMFCTIANPDYFKRTLEQSGFQVVNEFILPDHDSIREKDLEHFAQASLKSGASYLVCTEKDRVKLKDDLSLVLPVLWVQMNLQIVAGQEEWENFLKLAEAKIARGC